MCSFEQGETLRRFYDELVSALDLSTPKSLALNKKVIQLFAESPEGSSREIRRAHARL